MATVACGTPREQLTALVARLDLDVSSRWWKESDVLYDEDRGMYLAYIWTAPNAEKQRLSATSLSELSFNIWHYRQRFRRRQ